MMETQAIPVGLLILLGIMAGALYAGFWLVRKFIYPLIKIRRIRRLTEKWLFRAQLIAWATFTVFSLYRLLLASPMITVFLVALVVLLGWPFWRDFIPGILFRLDSQVTIKDMIRIDGQESSVEAVGLRNLISSNAAGETIITPYHQLNNAVVVRARAEGKLIKHSFSIRVADLEESEAGKTLGIFLSECPWSAPKQTPVVKSLGNGEFQVTAFAADKFAAEKQKAYTLWRLHRNQP